MVVKTRMGIPKNEYFHVYKYKDNYLSKDRTGKIVLVGDPCSSNLKMTVYDMCENYLHHDTALVIFNAAHQYEVTIEKIKVEE